MALKAPFPYFGAKSRAASLVWDRFGDVPNYVEPFAGSLAVPLARPSEPHIETVNDLNAFLANFWRAVKNDPGAVATWADDPVNEVDQHARHRWLCRQPQKTEFAEAMMCDPELFDAKRAGWWVWLLCGWIGSGCCDGEWFGPDDDGNHGRGVCNDAEKLPHLGDAGQGIHRQLPHLGNAGHGIHRKLPHLGDAGQGIHRQLPHLGDAGQGIHRQRPHLGNAGQGECAERREWLVDYMRQLSDRLRNVRVCCGDWTRVMGPCVTEKHGITGIFLDPPYLMQTDDGQTRDNCYGTYDSADVAHAVREWAIANGGNPLLRICLCGYEGEHAMPADWECAPWKAKGGYSSQNKNGMNNRLRERLWFSPACLRPNRQVQAELFQETK